MLTSDMDMIVTTQNHTSDLSCNWVKELQKA